MRFRAILPLGGKTATGIHVPDDVVARLGSRKRPAVHVTLNGYSYRSTLAVMGGQFMLPVSADVRAQARIAAGDEVDVEIDLDTTPRAVTLPPDVMEALTRDADAQRFFEGVSSSNKRRIVLSIEDAKTAETRQRRSGQPVARGTHRASRPSRRPVLARTSVLLLRGGP